MQFLIPRQFNRVHVEEHRTVLVTAKKRELTDPLPRIVNGGLVRHPRAAAADRILDTEKKNPSSQWGEYLTNFTCGK